MKMHEYFTVSYSDGRVMYEVSSIKEVIENRGNAQAIMEPTIHLWKVGDGYSVDYVRKENRYTLGCFENLDDALRFRNEVSQMEREDFLNKFMKEEDNK